MTSFDEAEAKCSLWGSRLFQPRSTASMAYFADTEVLHLKQELFGFATNGKPQDSKFY